MASVLNCSVGSMVIRSPTGIVRYQPFCVAQLTATGGAIVRGLVPL